MTDLNLLDKVKSRIEAPGTSGNQRRELQVLAEYLERAVCPLQSELVALRNLNDPCFDEYRLDISGFLNRAGVDPSKSHELKLFKVKHGRVSRWGAVQAGVMLPEEFSLGSRIWRDVGIQDFFYDRSPFYKIAPAGDHAYLRNENYEFREGNFFVFWGWNSTKNFGHMVHDLLSQLVYVDALKQLKIPTKYVVRAGPHGPFRYATMEFLFEALFGDSSDIIYLDEKNYIFEQLYFGEPALLWRANPWTVSSAAFKHLNQRLRQRLRFIDSGEKSEIWISRGDALNNRLIEGEQDVENFAKKSGFKPVEISKMRVPDIVATFYNAKVIAGAHGAGLMNFILSDPALTKIIELGLYPSTWRTIERTAIASGFDYTRIASEQPSATAAVGRIDVDVFAAELERAKSR